MAEQSQPPVPIGGSKPFKTPEHLHISEAVKQAMDVIEKRRRGLLMGLKTPWKKLNRTIGGGIQRASQYVIAGRSGVGKSAFVNLLIKGLFENNPKEKIIVLYFNFEMPSYSQVIRKLSNELSVPVSKLLSADMSLNEELYKKVGELKDKLSSFNIYFVDIPLNVTQIYAKIKEFKGYFPDAHLVNVFDHSRLVTTENEKDEMVKIGRLSKMCMYVKKEIGCSNIVVSQLNRNIEAPERARTQYEPMASDIFGADSLFQDADVVLVPHRPETYRIERYFDWDTKDFIALHVLKNRDGETGIIPFKHDLSTNKVEEI